MSFFQRRSQYRSRSISPVTAAAAETLEDRRLMASVAATTPFQGQQQVGAASNITVRFNEPMNVSTITSSTLQLRDAGGHLLNSVVTYDVNTKTATLNPDANLAATNSYYSVSVVGGVSGVKDSLGGTLTGGTFDFSFTPGIATFTEQVVFSGLIHPTSVQFAADGRVFVAEKRGVIKVFKSLTDSSPTIFADLRTQVHNYADRGLLGMVLDPQFTTGRPYVYVLYTFDGDINGTAPKYGTPNTDSDPGNTSGTSLVSGHLSRLTANGNVMAGNEQVLISDWANQFSSHSIGDLKFGPDGYLYASAGDGASYSSTDYGQFNNPFNDPINEGGALRAQDIRTPDDPTTLDGSIIRINPDTGAAAPTNPNIGNADNNAKRIIAYGLRNPYRITFRPGTNELWIADTGWNSWEEINRITDVGDAVVENFGWPAFEGVAPNGAFDGLNLPLLESLYSARTDTKPWFSYSHPQKVVAGSSEPTGGSTPTGLAFYTGFDQYGPGYEGALFFCDYARKQVYVMYRGVNGLPDAGTVQILRPITGAPVNLIIGPDGNLYYSDLPGGRLVRFNYSTPAAPTPPPPTTEGKLAGTVIGTSGSYANNGYTRDKVFDGDVFTFFDAPTASGAWVGLDFGSAKVVKQIKFAPRFDWAARLVGGRFQASNTADFSSGVVTLYTVTSAPTAGALTSVNVNAAGAAYRYVRFLGADNAAVNIAEMEFYDEGDTSTANGDGLRATFFNNINFTGTTSTRVDPVVHFFWGENDSPATGISPLTYSARWLGQVQSVAAGTYTFRVTGDDGVRLWVGDVLVIDQWKDQAPTAYTANVSFSANQLKNIRLEYYQNAYGGSVNLEWKRPGQSAFEIVPTKQLFSTGGPSIGTAPVPTIATPAASLKWKVGDTISFSGSATDAEDGTLPASALQWSLVLMHANLINPSNVHEHVVSSFSGVSSGTFVAPDHEYPSWLELRLSATDSSGQVTTITRRIDPLTINLTLAANVAGATMVFNDEFVSTPTTRTWIAGATATISAPAQVVVNGQTWVFTGWSNGGTRTQTISAPAVNTTLTANYAQGLGAPEQLTAAASGPKTVVLGWADTTTAETGFKVERRLASSTGDTGWTQIGTTSANVTTYTDTTAVAATAYQYRVRAASTTLGDSAYSNVAAVTTPASGPAGKLSGTVIGTVGSYANNGYTREQAFDGNVYTFFDAPTPSGAWVGLDFASAKVIKQIKFAPRFDWPTRLIGGVFQASNTADFSSGVVTLHTITTAPTAGQLTTVNVNAAGSSYRYVRFVSAPDAAVNIAEMEVYA